MIDSTGAVVMGRRSYDMGDTDEGHVDYEHQVPIFILTHGSPTPRPGTTPPRD